MDDLSAQPDASLLARVSRGESECFSELVRRYQPAMSRVARSRLGRADWAEDVVQETFLAVFKSSASYDPRYSFRTWLWTILLNQCHANFHRRLRSVPVESSTSAAEQAEQLTQDEGNSPLAALLAKERSAQLESLLGEMLESQADALRLRFFAGLKFHEIADAMQCSLNTAKNRVRSGLLHMAQRLQEPAQRLPVSDVRQDQALAEADRGANKA